jgi:hypothetical protein
MRHFAFKNCYLLASIIWCALLICAPDARALQYRDISKQSRIAILARGPIIAGDSTRLIEFVQALPSNDHIVGFIIDSPGGNVFEAEKLAGLIEKSGITVAVPSNGQCSSACFLLFAAASHRMAAPNALIGVHSVSENGKETIPSLALTTAMARDLAALGVPPEIIGKLVETPPGRATWLTWSDLNLMGVTALAEEQSGSYSPPSAPTYSAPEASAYGGSRDIPDSAGTATPEATTTYERGLADRRKVEAWFAGLTGDYREGAEYWAAHRSLPNAGSCYTADEGRLGDWTAGCLAAQKMLYPFDAERKSDPEYRAGWNNY